MCNCVSANHFVMTGPSLRSKMWSWHRPWCASRSYCLTVSANATTFSDWTHCPCVAVSANSPLIWWIGDWRSCSGLNPFSAHSLAAEHCLRGNLRVPVRLHCSALDYFSSGSSPSRWHNSPNTYLLDRCPLSVCPRICCSCPWANCTDSSLVVAHICRNRTRVRWTLAPASVSTPQSSRQSFQNLNSTMAMSTPCCRPSMDYYANRCCCSADFSTIISFWGCCARNSSVYFGCSWTEYSTDYRMGLRGLSWWRARRPFAFRRSHTAEIKRKCVRPLRLEWARERLAQLPISYWQLSYRPKCSTPIQCGRTLCPVPSQSPISLRHCQRNSIRHSHWT